MEPFSPLINLLTLLTVLSIAAERATNVFKLRRPDLRSARKTEDDEKDRERQITQACVIVSIVLALLVKADFFEILVHLDAPWETLGWVRLQGAEWVRSPAASGLSQFLYALGGSAVTGVALGFGSKFWHDMLDIVLNARENLKRLRQRPIA
jgi:hypothetical protein